MSGFVYIMTNESLKKGEYKHGNTSTTPEKRSLQLEKSCYCGLKGKWTTLYSREINRFLEAERIIHIILKSKKIYIDKEIFKIKIEDAKAVLDIVCDSLESNVEDLIFSNNIDPVRKRGTEREGIIARRVVLTKKNLVKEVIPPTCTPEDGDKWILQFNRIDDFKTLASKVRTEQRCPYKDFEYLLVGKSFFLEKRVLILDGITPLISYPRGLYLSIRIEGITYDIAPDRQDSVTIIMKKKTK